MQGVRLMARSKVKEKLQRNSWLQALARGVVSLVDVRADLNPLGRVVGGWTALALDGTCSSANANR